MANPALVIMTRVPCSQGKSRLSGILTPGQRKDLQWALLGDALEKAGHVPGSKCFVAATPASQVGELKKVLRPDLEIITQPVGDLGQRMLSAIRDVYGLNHSPVIVLGTDVPLLPVSYLTGAIELLGSYQLVFGPALDGGYYLIGMRCPVDVVFDDVDWGGEKVLERSIAICKKNNLSYCLLGPLRDLDRPADLLNLWQQTNNLLTNTAGVPLNTVKFLREFINERVKSLDSYYNPADLAKFATIGEEAPGLWEKFMDYYGAVFQEGALSAREKALVALAVAHALQCPYCIEAYTREALEKGSSEEQMTEAVHVAAAIKGGATLVHGVQMKNICKKVGF